MTLDGEGSANAAVVPSFGMSLHIFSIPTTRHLHHYHNPNQIAESGNYLASKPGFWMLRCGYALASLYASIGHLPIEMISQILATDELAEQPQTQGSTQDVSPHPSTSSKKACRFFNTKNGMWAIFYFWVSGGSRNSLGF